jgi:hypothetical protein
LYGIAFGDIAMLGLAHDDFLMGNNADPPQYNRGIGFTQITIHEVGHMVGLMHPHEYGSLGDYVSSVMSYYAYEYSFSRFDCDAVQRSQADQLIIEASSALEQAKATAADRSISFELSDKLKSAEDLLRKAEQQYSMMNYASALQYAKTAAVTSREALTDAGNQVYAIPVFTIAGIAIGLIIGYFGIPYFKKKRIETVPETIKTPAEQPDV